MCTKLARIKYGKKEDEDYARRINSTRREERERGNVCEWERESFFVRYLLIFSYSFASFLSYLPSSFAGRQSLVSVLVVPTTEMET